MHSHGQALPAHDHTLPKNVDLNERRVRVVAALTFVTMLAEVLVGRLSGSMALLADGWHMATHTVAMLLAASTYWLARRIEHDKRFSFGAGKVFALGGYTSALLLGAVGLWMAVESFVRFFEPRTVDYSDALPVAIFGLVVNIVSAKLLDAHEHEHEHESGHDHNLRSAYLHVLADVLTSVLAIAALVAGKLWSAAWADPAVGVLGAVMVVRWAGQLVLSSSRHLLDGVPDIRLDATVRARLEEIDDVIVTDLHIWTLAPGRVACIVSLVTSCPRETAHYRNLLLGDFSHVTVEVHRCVEGHAA